MPKGSERPYVQPRSKASENRGAKLKKRKALKHNLRTSYGPDTTPTVSWIPKTRGPKQDPHRPKRK